MGDPLNHDWGRGMRVRIRYNTNMPVSHVWVVSRVLLVREASPCEGVEPDDSVNLLHAQTAQAMPPVIAVVQARIPPHRTARLARRKVRKAAIAMGVKCRLD
jgi:hypothetical protein